MNTGTNQVKTPWPLTELWVSVIIIIIINKINIVVVVVVVVIIIIITIIIIIIIIIIVIIIITIIIVIIIIIRTGVRPFRIKLRSVKNKSYNNINNRGLLHRLLIRYS